MHHHTAGILHLDTIDNLYRWQRANGRNLWRNRERHELFNEIIKLFTVALLTRD